MGSEKPGMVSSNHPGRNSQTPGAPNRATLAFTSSSVARYSPGGKRTVSPKMVSAGGAPVCRRALDRVGDVQLPARLLRRQAELGRAASLVAPGFDDNPFPFR